MKTYTDGFDAARLPHIVFGPGRLDSVPPIAAALAGGAGPVLVVADLALAGLGATDRLAGGMAKAGLGVEMAAEVAGEPKEALVDALAARARETGCAAVIGMGGGAAMDAAKLVAAVAAAGEPAHAYALAASPVPARTLPAIAVPTTAGTGSEVTRTAIVSTAEGHKLWYFADGLMFAHAVLDPELTLTVPPHVTAWTGIDAACHAIEAATGRSASPAGSLPGLAALELIVEALPRAVAHGDDLEARGRMMWAATLAGIALHNCFTHLGHNISHALGSLAPVPHGLATGLALEVALQWAVGRPGGEAAYARAARALGGPEEAAALPGRFSALMRAVGIPPRLPAVCAGIGAEALAAQMKAPANLGMSQNAACAVTAADLDALAAAVTALPPEERAAREA
jgi:alcohol dehydrogenase class IV